MPKLSLTELWYNTGHDYRARKTGRPREPLPPRLRRVRHPRVVEYAPGRKADPGRRLGDHPAVTDPWRHGWTPPRRADRRALPCQSVSFSPTYCGRLPRSAAPTATLRAVLRSTAKARASQAMLTSSMIPKPGLRAPPRPT